MKVAVVSSISPDPSGESQYSTKVYKIIAQKFPDIKILILTHKENNKKASEEIILPNLLIKRIICTENRFKASISVISLFKHILQFEADIVHFQGTHTPKYGGLLGEPILLLMFLLKLFKIPTVITIHSLWRHEDLKMLWKEKGYPLYISKIFVKYYKAYLKTISLIVDAMNLLVSGRPTELIYEYVNVYRLRKKVVKLEPHPCDFINLTDEQKIKSKSKFGFEKNRVVTSIGFVRYDKGYHILLNSANSLLSKFDDLIIVIAGFPQRAEDLKYAELLGRIRDSLPNKERIILLFKLLDNEEFLALLEASDIIVLPYIRAVGASGPMHSALGMGIPVIASTLHLNLGLKEISLLVPPNDSAALAEAIELLLSKHEVYLLYSQKAKNYASSWTWEDLARFYVQEYYDIIKRSKLKK